MVKKRHAICSDDIRKYFKDIIIAHDAGKTIQIKVSHREGFVDATEYPIDFKIKMGIQYRIKPEEN